ncbi:probable G-protein coupled receptor Mth-like 4 [Mytilus californianus]|uniref:probable G-protein coupled receptor Mth-like 4 n=1 Tax=Mytilus californianus TaxID=6549 RepID=UPI002246FC48|nr:probable G-protein coupled receptor Mth-like 4 [Mytilus californianus]
MITYVAFDLFIKSNINRNDLEQSLLNIAQKSSDKRSIDIRLASSLPELLNSVLADYDFKNESHCWTFEENRDYLEKYERYASTNIQKQIFCPQLELEFDQFDIDGSSLLITKHNIKIPKDKFLMDSNYKIRVCVDDFSSFLSKKSIKSSTEYALEITTIVCTCVSLFCLLLTFITYSLFPLLRTLPGKNNMCLILSLFIAQACLQFGTIWTNRLFVCATIGVILHVFWLATFACMNVCSYHMYSVFTILKATASSSENTKLFCKYLCYSFGTPLSIVIINIIIHIVLSGGTKIGYGEINCFISGHIPKLAAFICPVAVICVINIWLFGFTAYKIYNRPVIQSTANTKHDFFVYIKLFSLTGITWIGQIIDSFVPLSLFSFVVTILTGLQGLFIFLSFVCNKRVIKLFLEIFNVIRENKGGKVADPLSKTDSNPYPNSSTSITSDRNRPP